MGINNRAVLIHHLGDIRNKGFKSKCTDQSELVSSNENGDEALKTRVTAVFQNC